MLSLVLVIFDLKEVMVELVRFPAARLMVYCHVIDGTAISIFHTHASDAITPTQKCKDMPPRIKMLVFVSVQSRYDLISHSL